MRTLLAAAALLAAPAAASDGNATALRAHLDALVGLQRDGGWTYASAPGERPRPLTFGLGWAERLAAPVDLARWQTVVIRSPGTPQAGLVLLAGHRLTGDARYLAAARAAGDALLALELPGGGWFSEMPLQDRRLPGWFPYVVPGPSIDDDVTPGASRFLVALWKATGDARYRAAAERGVGVLVDAQLPSGAWPLCVRRPWVRAVRPGFEDLATLNDGATSAAVVTLLDAAAALERPELARVAVRGGAWLVRMRGTPPSAAWAQQYDDAGRPAPGRRFELPALASWETRLAVDALDRLATATGDARWCAPVADAAAWLAASAIAPGCWARLYDPANNAPVFVAADGTRVADAARARPGYAWTGDFGIPALLARLGASLPPGVEPVPYVAGDPGTCPGETPVGIDADLPGDARAHVARAATWLAQHEAPATSPCTRPAAR